jgi:hypothetical protein
MKTLCLCLLCAVALVCRTACASFAGDYELIAKTGGQIQFLADLHINAGGTIRGESVAYSTYKTARVTGSVKASGKGRINLGQGNITIQVKRAGQGLTLIGRSKNIQGRALILNGRFARAGVYPGQTSEPDQHLIILIGPDRKATVYSNFGPRLDGEIEGQSPSFRLSLQSSDGSFILHGQWQGTTTIKGNVGAAATLSSFTSQKL